MVEGSTAWSPGGWIDRTMDPWIDSCFVDLRIDVSMCRWIGGSPDRWLDGSMDRLANGILGRSVVGSRDRRSDRWSDGAKDASIEASTARGAMLRPLRPSGSHFFAFWGPFWEPWGSFWEPLGVIWGAFGGHFGHAWVTLFEGCSPGPQGCRHAAPFGHQSRPRGSKRGPESLHGRASAPSKSPLGRFWASQNGVRKKIWATLGGLGGPMYVFHR